MLLSYCFKNQKFINKNKKLNNVKYIHIIMIIYDFNIMI